MRIKKLINKKLGFNGLRIFLLLTIITTLITFTINELFLTYNVYYKLFGENMAIDRIAKMIELSRKWQWIGYIVASVLILIRVSFTASCIYIGSFIGNLNIRFKELFKVALLADFVFVLAGITKLLMLIFVKEVSTLEDIQFQPLSLLELFGKGAVDPILVYPYSLISVFELLYWLALAWLLSGVVNKSFGRSLKTVAVSYGSGLLLWVLFVMFITLNLSS